MHTEEAGYVNFSVKMTEADRMEPITEQVLKESLTQKITMGRLIVDLYCAESLLAGDEDGSTDPYFSFHYCAARKQSSQKNSILNPIYF